VGRESCARLAPITVHLNNTSLLFRLGREAPEWPVPLRRYLPGGRITDHILLGRG